MIKDFCRECGKEFITKATYRRRGENRGRYCSRTCGAIFRSKVKSSTCENRVKILRPGFEYDLKLHGGGSKLHSIWTSMKYRCFNEKCKDYKFYGGRGISVCDSWRDSYPDFLLWTADSGYKEGLTLDREDNSKGYSPDNCKWVSRKAQARNTRGNVFTIEDVREIRDQHKAGSIVVREVAARFKTSTGNVYSILNNETWVE
jgi:hypothetical protein